MVCPSAVVCSTILASNVNGIVKLLYTEYAVLPSSVVTVSVMIAFLLYKSYVISNSPLSYLAAPV